MNEEQWTNSTDPGAMLDWLRQQGRLSERKARLFAFACCRRIWHLLADTRCHSAVEIAEKHADMLACGEELQRSWEALDALARPAEDIFLGIRKGAAEVPHTKREMALGELAVAVAWWASFPRGDTLWLAAAEAAVHSRRALSAGATVAGTMRLTEANLLRDNIGNPFRPPPPIPASVLQWNDGLIKRLAEQAYDQRQLPSGQLDNARLAVLADALLEAGCDDADIIGHLRGLRPHWRGCHVLDALLGKE